MHAACHCVTEAHGKSKRAKLARSPTLVLARRPKRSATLRPVPFSEGANDELALTMGQSRVQLGMNMAATAIPKVGDMSQVGTTIADAFLL